jgi:hypothetical protein
VTLLGRAGLRKRRTLVSPSCPARSQACADCVNLSAMPGIHVLRDAKTWMAATSAAMTERTAGLA